jgi:hypothetical protein
MCRLPILIQDFTYIVWINERCPEEERAIGISVFEKISGSLRKLIPLIGCDRLKSEFLCLFFRENLGALYVQLTAGVRIISAISEEGPHQWRINMVQNPRMFRSHPLGVMLQAIKSVRHMA